MGLRGRFVDFIDVRLLHGWLAHVPDAHVPDAHVRFRALAFDGRCQNPFSVVRHTEGF